MLLKFRVFGETRTYNITADEYETVEEVITRLSQLYDIKTPNANTTIIFNGRIVNKSLTLSYNQMKDGNTIIIYSKSKTQETQETKETKETQETQEVEEYEEEYYQDKYQEKYQTYEEEMFKEQCRIADLGFVGWECDQHAPKIFEEMYEEEQRILSAEDDENRNFESFINQTIISQPSKICDKPLPQFFLCFD